MTSEVLRTRLSELEVRDWNLPEIEARFKKLVAQGIPKNTQSMEEIIGRKQEILDFIQQRAEEYCYLTRNCAKGSALALMETFGLGNMEMIRALSPFPGIGMTGGICGPVTGGLIALGLFFSNKDIADFQDTSANIAARKYTRRFEQAFGSLLCPQVQEFILGQYFDPMAGQENYEKFNQANARVKCPLAPGAGARIAAEVIIESMEKKKSA